ncbi:MAG: hypothetical protein EA359_07995 [Balneolaceae bacterium]|nr:MAG: hypothetical protein EA359_07995 [Balneolaceae bacterium]
MKTIISTSLAIKFFLLFAIITLQAVHLFARQAGDITGIVTDSETKESVPFAHIALLDATGSGFLAGTVSDIDGIFTLNYSEGGTVILRISAIGYETWQIEKVLESGLSINLGEIPLTFATITHEGITVVGEVTARTEAGRTSYYVNENMVAVSSAGTDILKMIPGVEVDIMQNISLEGSRSILIFVDGKERDRSYLNQLHPSQISRVDILNMPPASFDAGITGAINIVLNQKPENHLSGHVNLDVPAIQSEKYLFPAYSIHYGTGRINFFTSYNGEFSYFDVMENSRRTTPISVWESRQNVRQQYWSHKFHYGMDVDLGKRHEFGFYGWLNPYSQENSGTAELIVTGENRENWLADKKDEDSNLGAFYALSYNFTPESNNGSHLRVDAAYQTLEASNTITYTGLQDVLLYKNRVEPVQQTFRFRADLNQPVTDNVSIETGFHLTSLSLRDRAVDEYRYNHGSLAGYGSLSARFKQFEFTGGMRVERIVYGLNSNPENKLMALFPNASIKYQFPGTGQNIRLSYRRSAQYPHLYQLSPVVTADDPYSNRSGNPALDPAVRGQVNLEYSVLFGSSFITANLFYTQHSRAIHTLNTISPDGIYESIWLNMGDVRQAGIRFSGSLNLGDRTGIQPYLSLYDVQTSPNSVAKEHGLTGQRSYAYETGLSAFAGFGSGFMASVLFQYASPAAEIQRSLFSDALYFVSLEKSFGPDLKAGIVSALPFAKSFTYGGHKIEGIDFESRSEGIIRTSAVPFWFTLNYRFSRGNAKERSMNVDVIAPDVPRRGL